MKREANLLLEKHMAELGLEFDTEYRFHPVRLWRADYRITNRLRNGQMMLIEIEGGVHRFKSKTGVMIVGHHHHQKGFQSDLDKYNQAVKLGYGVLRFSTQDVLRGRAKEFLKSMFNGGEKA